VLVEEKDGDIMDLGIRLLSPDKFIFQKEVATSKRDLLLELPFSVKNKCALL
jgi:hypothetical protein